MTVTTLNTEERIACAICWLYRWRGSQPVVLSYEVAERHGTTCDWCEYPLDRLIQLCDLAGAPDVEVFRRFPAKTQAELVIKALHEKSA